MKTDVEVTLKGKRDEVNAVMTRLIRIHSDIRIETVEDSRCFDNRTVILRWDKVRP